MSGLTLSAVETVWLAQVGGCETMFSGVMCLEHVGVVRIGVCVNLLNVLGGLLQETIEDECLCNFPRKIILPALPFFFYLIGEVTL